MNLKIVDELKIIEFEEAKSAYRKKMLYKGYSKTYDFTKFKARRASGNAIVLSLQCIWQTINKTNQQNHLDNLKTRQDHQILILKKEKENNK